MTVALQASIAVPVAKAQIRLTFTADVGNFVRAWCTAAPAGSKLRGKLDENKSARVHVKDSDSGEAFDYTFDVAGAYQIAATELTKGAKPYGGGYQGAPDAERSESVIGETALTIYVAASIKSTIGHGQDTADLTLYVANDLIRETTLAVHGRATPAVEKAKTDKAATAAEASAVTTALAALIDTNASGALGDLSATATDIIDRFNAHIASGVFHNAGDVSDNKILVAFRNPVGPEALKRSVSAILKALSAHIRNDSVTTPTGTGTRTWHLFGADNRVDWQSMPLFESSATVADHVRALADAWRSFEAHRTSAAHNTSDTTNTLSALPLLIDVHRLFLTELASLSPNVPNTENPAKTILVHGAGFEET